MFIIFFLVLEVFQVFHFLHLAAVHGWPPAANFTLEIKSSSCNAVVFTISIFTALQEFFNILFIRIMLKNTCKAAKICVFPFLFLTMGFLFSKIQKVHTQCVEKDMAKHSKVKGFA